MAKTYKVYDYPFTGLKEVIANINKEIAKIEEGTLRGLMQAGLLVKRDSQIQTPVRYGNLRASGYVVVSGIGHTADEISSFGDKPNRGPEGKKLFNWHQKMMKESIATAYVPSDILYAEIGHTMPYAAHVHEHNKNYMVGNWKFLENSFKKNQKKIIQIIAENARIK